MSTLAFGEIADAKLADETIFTLKKASSVGESIMVGIVLPAKDCKYVKWEVFGGDSDLPLKKGELGELPDTIFFDVVFETAGKYQLILIIRDSSENPTLIDKTFLEVKKSFFAESFERAFGFMMGSAVTIVIFWMQRLIEDKSKSKAQKKRLNSEIRSLLCKIVQAIKRSPDQQLPPLPNWFIGNDMTDWSWRLYTSDYSDLRLKIESTHRRCQSSIGNQTELQSCISDIEKMKELI